MSEIEKLTQVQEKQYIERIMAEVQLEMDATEKIEQEVAVKLAEMGLHFVLDRIDRTRRKVSYDKGAGRMRIDYTAGLIAGYVDIIGVLHIQSDKIEIRYSFNGGNSKILTEQNFIQDYAVQKLDAVKTLINLLDTTHKRADLETHVTEKVERLEQLDPDGLYDQAFGWKAIAKAKLDDWNAWNSQLVQAKRDEEERQEKEAVWITQAEQVYAAEFETWAASVAKIRKQNKEYIAGVQAALDLKPFWWAELQYTYSFESSLTETVTTATVVILGLAEGYLRPQREYYNLLLSSGEIGKRHFENIVWVSAPRLAEPDNRKPYNTKYIDKGLVLYVSPFESMPEVKLKREPEPPIEVPAPDYVRRATNFQKIRYEIMEKYNLDR